MIAPESWLWLAILISFWVMFFSAFHWVRYANRTEYNRTTQRIESKLNTLTSKVDTLITEMRAERKAKAQRRRGKTKKGLKPP
jgi:hypothetical protein